MTQLIGFECASETATTTNPEHIYASIDEGRAAEVVRHARAKGFSFSGALDDIESASAEDWALMGMGTAEPMSADRKGNILGLANAWAARFPNAR